jgi:hypothetical protein
MLYLGIVLLLFAAELNRTTFGIEIILSKDGKNKK